LVNKLSSFGYDAGSTPTMAGIVTLFVPWIDTTVLALEDAAAFSVAMVALLLSAAFAFLSPSFFCAPGVDASLLLATATTAWETCPMVGCVYEELSAFFSGRSMASFLMVAWLSPAVLPVEDDPRVLSFFLESENGVGACIVVCCT
jgi:hypothetical protein